MRIWKSFARCQRRKMVPLLFQPLRAFSSISSHRLDSYINIKVICPQTKAILKTFKHEDELCEWLIANNRKVRTRLLASVKEHVRKGINKENKKIYGYYIIGERFSYMNGEMINSKREAYCQQRAQNRKTHGGSNYLEAKGREILFEILRPHFHVRKAPELCKIDFAIEVEEGLWYGIQLKTTTIDEKKISKFWDALGYDKIAGTMIFMAFDGCKDKKGQIWAMNTSKIVKNDIAIGTPRTREKYKDDEKTPEELVNYLTNVISENREYANFFFSGDRRCKTSEWVSTGSYAKKTQIFSPKKKNVSYWSSWESLIELSHCDSSTQIGSAGECLAAQYLQKFYKVLYPMFEGSKCDRIVNNRRGQVKTSITWHKFEMKREENTVCTILTCPA